MTLIERLALCALGAASLASPTLAAAQVTNYPVPAESHPYRHHYRHYRHYRTCGADERRRANNGTAIGAVSGGILGSALGGGLGNTLLGAGAGAVAGHEIGKRTTRC